MGTRGVCIGPGDTRGTRLQARAYGLHDFLHVAHLDLRETHDVDLLFVILSAVNHFSVVKEVVELPAVDLVERHKQSELGIGLKQVADVEGCQKVETWVAAIL